MKRLLKEILEELRGIRKELQAIRNSKEFKVQIDDELIAQMVNRELAKVHCQPRV